MFIYMALHKGQVDLWRVHSVCICLGRTMRLWDGRHRKSTRSLKSKAANECIKLDWMRAVSVSGRIIMNRDE